MSPVAAEQNATLVEIPVTDLVWPHRLDVLARVEALRAYDTGGAAAALETSYGRFMAAERGVGKIDPRTALSEFIALYESIKIDGYDVSTAITIADYGGAHVAAWPLAREIPSLVVPGRYSLLRGAHRLACLLHLGHTVATVRLVDAEQIPPDYTTFMSAVGIAVDPQVVRSLTVPAPWPASPLRDERRKFTVALTALELELADSQRRVAEKNAAMQRAEDHISRLLYSLQLHETRLQTATAELEAQRGAAAAAGVRARKADARASRAEQEARRLRRSRSFRFAQALRHPLRGVHRKLRRSRRGTGAG